MEQVTGRYSFYSNLYTCFLALRELRQEAYKRETLNRGAQKSTPDVQLRLDLASVFQRCMLVWE